MRKIMLFFTVLTIFLGFNSTAFSKNTGFTFCESTYALCTTARCNTQSGNQDVADCVCDVKIGLSVGTEACQAVKAPKTGDLIKSRYHPVKSLAVCTNSAPWALCLDASCRVDSNGKAICTCPIVQNSDPYVIVTDTYTESTCNSGIISSATLDGEEAVTDYLKSINQLPYDYQTLENIESVFIPLVNPDYAFMYESPEISIGFNDDMPFPVTVALGATGIYMGNHYFKVPDLGRNDPSYIGSSSQKLFASGGTYHGNWYMTSVNIYNPSSNPQEKIATAKVPVLALSSKTCAASETECEPLNADGMAKFYKFGAGYAQELVSAPQGTPDKNPFLNIVWTATGGVLPSGGFLVTSNYYGVPGFLLGVSGIYTGDFSQIKLQPLLSPRYSQWQIPPANPALLTDWQNPTADISVNGVSGRGSLLIDTDFEGIGVGYVTAPLGAQVSTHPPSDTEECTNCADNGTKIKITIPSSQTSATVSYNYVVGDSSNFLAPPEVTIMPVDTPFATVSFHFYTGFDYFYDAERGFIGLKALSSTPKKYAESTAGVNLENVFQCTFKSLDASMSASPSDKVTMYSYPYTYHYYSATESYVGISSGDDTSSANTLYRLTSASIYPEPIGSLASWSAAAACQ